MTIFLKLFTSDKLVSPCENSLMRCKKLMHLIIQTYNLMRSTRHEVSSEFCEPMLNKRENILSTSEREVGQSPKHDVNTNSINTKCLIEVIDVRLDEKGGEVILFLYIFIVNIVLISESVHIFGIFFENSSVILILKIDIYWDLRDTYIH